MGHILSQAALMAGAFQVGMMMHWTGTWLPLRAQPVPSELWSWAGQPLPSIYVGDLDGAPGS